MDKLSRSIVPEAAAYPEKILQFGEGNFLRAFVDWQVHVLNRKTDFAGSVVVVQPRGSEKIERLNKQDGLFTLYLQGMKDGKPVDEHMVVDSITRGINLFSDYDSYIDLAGEEELRFIVSNTTEAGIAFDPEVRLEDRPQKNFTGKLAAFLYYRFTAFDGDREKGCVILPCELIENNGEKLRDVILQYADHWYLGEKFSEWIVEANLFCSTLVDRIVPGYPVDTAEEKTAELGYEDELLVVGEQYHLWVIEGPESLEKELPIKGTGLNTLFVNDLDPYRKRKVHILNGAHTAMTPLAFLYGLETVEETINHEKVGPFIKEMIKEEIIPMLDGSEEELSAYAEEVISRFQNPFIKHYLLSISLNSISKFCARNLPILLDYESAEGRLPERIVFSLSCLLQFYKGQYNGRDIPLQDEPLVLQKLGAAWEKVDSGAVTLEGFVESILADEELWARDLSKIPGLAELIAAQLSSIEQNGVQAALDELLAQGGAVHEEFLANQPK